MVFNLAVSGEGQLAYALGKRIPFPFGLVNSVILLTVLLFIKEMYLWLHGFFQFWEGADVYFFECAMCMCVYHDVLMHAVKIMNGRSANTWHVCRKLANHRAVRNLSTPRCDGKSCLYSCVCPDTCRRLSNRTSFVDDSLLL